MNRLKSVFVALVFTLISLISVFAQENTAKGTEYRAQEPGVVQAKKESQKPFTVSASLREEYDDNIFTQRTDKTSQYKTIIEPSILYNLLLDQTLLSSRYTFGLTYYPDRKDRDIDTNHEYIGRINHSFSSRFNIDARERFRITQEPQVLEGAARTLRTNSSYLSNVASLQGNMQWTPKFGTVTSYSNDMLDYQDKTVSETNDRTLHTIGNDFRFLVLPTTTVITGATATVTDYAISKRDSETYVATVGVDHQISPSVTVGVRGGPSWTKLDEGGDFVSPYGNAFASWQIGARSKLDASYTHSVSETDIGGYYAQESNTFSLDGRYEFTPKIYTRLGTRYTLGEFNSDLGVGAGALKIEEDVIGLEWGVGYKVSPFIELELGYSYTEVISDQIDREYARNRVYFGVRGTY